MYKKECCREALTPSGEVKVSRNGQFAKQPYQQTVEKNCKYKLPKTLNIAAATLHKIIKSFMNLNNSEHGRKLSLGCP